MGEIRVLEESDRRILWKEEVFIYEVCLSFVSIPVYRRERGTCVEEDRQKDGGKTLLSPFILLSLPLVSFVRARLPIDGRLAARDGADGQGGGLTVRGVRANIW